MNSITTLLKISWRNVLRNKRRSFLTLMILIVGCSCLTLMGGFLDDLMWTLRETSIHGQLGHLAINKKGYWDRGSGAPYNFLIQDSRALQNQIESGLPSAFTVPRIKFGGMLSNDSEGISVIAYGVDPAKETKMNSYVNPGLKKPVTNIVEGQDLDESDPQGIVVGTGLMKILGLKIGDRVTLVTTRQEGAIDGSEFHIRGAFETILKEVGERLVKVPIRAAQDVLAIPNQINSLIVVLENTEDTNAAHEFLKGKLRKYPEALEIIPWTEQSLLYNQAKRFFDNLFFIMKLIISAIFVFSISNTINMALFERIREYGTMMAIGNARGTVFGMIVCEAAILGLIGSAIGILAGIGLTHVVIACGLKIPPPPNTGGNEWFFVHFLITPKLLLQMFLISFVSTILSSLVPAYRASHFRITHALGYV